MWLVQKAGQLYNLPSDKVIEVDFFWEESAGSVFRVGDDILSDIKEWYIRENLIRDQKRTEATLLQDLIRPLVMKLSSLIESEVTILAGWNFHDDKSNSLIDKSFSFVNLTLQHSKYMVR